MSLEIYHSPKNNITPENCFRADEIRPVIYDLIKKDKPDITKNSFITIEELNNYRMLHLSMIVQQEKGDADKLDKDEKIDHLIVNHNRRLFETQEILTEILDDMMNDVHSLMKDKAE